MRVLILFFLLCCTTVLPASAQNDSVALSGSKFSTERRNIVWMGSNYRTEWNTPVKAPVLDLTGLTPTKLGGGKQTKSLRLEDANGREYVLRSIQKFITSK